MIIPVVVNTKLLHTDDTMLGGFPYQNSITVDSFVPASRQNRDTSTTPKSTNYKHSFQRKFKKNIILNSWKDVTKSRYERSFRNGDCFVRNGKQIPLFQMWTLYCNFWMVFLKEVVCTVVFVQQQVLFIAQSQFQNMKDFQAILKFLDLLKLFLTDICHYLNILLSVT